MRKRLKKLTLNKETVSLLSLPQLHLAQGGAPSATAIPGGECLTDYCSKHYCFTHLDTCTPCVM
jgi:hypothetical protein